MKPVIFGQHDGWRLGRLGLERCPRRDRARVEALITFGVQAFLFPVELINKA